MQAVHRAAAWHDRMPMIHRSTRHCIAADHCQTCTHVHHLHQDITASTSLILHQRHTMHSMVFIIARNEQNWNLSQSSNTKQTRQNHHSRTNNAGSRSLACTLRTHRSQFTNLLTRSSSSLSPVTISGICRRSPPHYHHQCLFCCLVLVFLLSWTFAHLPLAAIPLVIRAAARLHASQRHRQLHVHMSDTACSRPWRSPGRGPDKVKSGKGGGGERKLSR